MAQGRCPGCGRSGSVRSIEAHVSGCVSYAERFAAGEELRAPAEEFAHHAATSAIERTAETKPRPAAREPRKKSAPPATVVPSGPKAPASRPPAPVYVERWQVPEFL